MTEHDMTYPGNKKQSELIFKDIPGYGLFVLPGQSHQPLWLEWFRLVYKFSASQPLGKGLPLPLRPTAPFWNHFGTNLGPKWHHVGVIFGLFGTLGRLQGRFFLKKNFLSPQVALWCLTLATSSAEGLQTSIFVGPPLQLSRFWVA